MINSVSGMSNVSFKQNAMDKVTPELMNQPGAYSQNPMAPTGPAEEQPRKGSFLGAVTKLILTAAVVVGGAIAARKYIPALGKEKVAGDVLKEGATLAEQAKHHFAKYTDNAAAQVEKCLNFFKSKPKEAPKGIDPAKSSAPASVMAEAKTATANVIAAKGKLSLVV